MVRIIEFEFVIMTPLSDGSGHERMICSVFSSSALAALEASKLFNNVQIHLAIT
jgi:hypothetical protein